MEINRCKWSNSCEAANQKASQGQVGEISTITTHRADSHSVSTRNAPRLVVHCSGTHQELFWFSSSVSCNTSKPSSKWIVPQPCSRHPHGQPSFAPAVLFLQIVKQTWRRMPRFSFILLHFEDDYSEVQTKLQIWREMEKRRPSPPRRFVGMTADGMSGEMKLFPEVVRLLRSSVLVLDCSVRLSTSSADSPTLFSSFPLLQKVNDNGFYLMFFSLLSHFPICSTICQCHLCLGLSECSFTLANRVVLTTDDDVDRGDGLHEWKFIYVAFTPKQAWNGSLLNRSLHTSHLKAVVV